MARKKETWYNRDFPATWHCLRRATGNADPQAKGGAGKT